MRRALVHLAVLAIALSWGLPPAGAQEDPPPAEATTAPAPSQTQTAEDLARARFNEGLMALRTQPPQLPTAIDRFEQVVQRMPDWAEAHYNLGLAYHKQGNTVKAIPALERATLIDPKLGDAWVVLGTMYEEQNRPGAALDAYAQCVKHSPDNTDCRIGEVRYAAAQGESPKQIVDRIKRILEINSTSVGAYVLLSEAYMDQGDLELAKFALDKARKANPLAEQNPTVHCNLGMIYRAKGLDFEAKQEWEKALQLDPNHVQTIVNLSNLLIFNLDYAGAKQLLDRAMLREPTHEGVRLAMGIAKQGTGDLEGAKADFQYILDNDPANTDALYNLAVLYNDHFQDYDKAIETWDELIRNSPGLAKDDPIHEYREDSVKAIEREKARIEREERKRQREAEKAAREKEEAERRAAEEAKAAEEAAAAPPEESPPEQPPAEGEPPADEAAPAEDGEPTEEGASGG